MGLINHDAKEIFLEKIKEFGNPEEENQKRNQMREEFVTRFTPANMRNLKPEDYFPGLGKKEGCIGYELEWATRSLGSIKGGSIAKYGPKEQFNDIRKLLTDLTGLSDDTSKFYDQDGKLTNASRKLVAESSTIRGMKSGRTVLGKLLSIYYPDTFIPLFNDQEYLLGKILKEHSDDSIGLESFLKNNYLFLEVKRELLSEPAFTKEIAPDKFTNNILGRFLYFCFPKTQPETEDPEGSAVEEGRIEALETQHYQKLIHRNFGRLFKSYRYYDEELQNEHDGHFATENVGIMDFLCLDEKNNFVVIELKRRGKDETLAQLCRYMGWVKENLAQDGQKVRGLIVSESKDANLEFAIKVVPGVAFKQMRLDVSIDDFES
jgi:hypothetical protein